MKRIDNFFGFYKLNQYPKIFFASAYFRQYLKGVGLAYSMFWIHSGDSDFFRFYLYIDYLLLC